MEVTYYVYCGMSQSNVEKIDRLNIVSQVGWIGKIPVGVCDTSK